jgi:hypothetical protein
VLKKDCLWPMAEAAAGSYLGYTGRAANLVATAAFDPTRTFAPHTVGQGRWLPCRKLQPREERLHALQKVVAEPGLRRLEKREVDGLAGRRRIGRNCSGFPH